MFGGVFGDKLLERKVNNKTFFFPIGKGSINRWKEIETVGSAPEGRFYHGQHYYERGNYIVVFGGRRFPNPAAGVRCDSEFVNEIALLRVDTLTWYKAHFKKELFALKCFPELFSFSSELIDDRIIVFGGMFKTRSYSK